MKKIKSKEIIPRLDSHELKDSVPKSSSKVPVEKTVNKAWSPPWKQ